MPRNPDVKILLLGSGGREHAFAHRLKNDSWCETLYCAPGNTGTESLGENVPLSLTTHHDILAFAKKHDIDLIMPGSEEQLINGFVDYFNADPAMKGRFCGPSAKGAKLEGSKIEAKHFLYRNGVPTPAAKTFKRSEYTKILSYLDSLPGPYVIKASGPALGKGVSIHHDRKAAVQEVGAICMENKFADAGEHILIEEFKEGEELSVFLILSHTGFRYTYKILPPAKDYKTLHDGNKGDNTGGMGSVSPDFITANDPGEMDIIRDTIIEPLIGGLEKEEIDYRGIMYVSLMKTETGYTVIEINCRMGDPEAQSSLMRIRNDVIPYFVAAAQGNSLDELPEFDIDPRFAVTVVAVAEGYPNTPVKGDIISGEIINQHPKPGTFFFHAGIKRDGANLVTNGGRVYAATALGDTVKEAQAKAYELMQTTSFRGRHYRTDIGERVYSSAVLADSI